MDNSCRSQIRHFCDRCPAQVLDIDKKTRIFIQCNQDDQEMCHTANQLSFLQACSILVTAVSKEM